MIGIIEGDLAKNLHKTVLARANRERTHGDFKKNGDEHTATALRDVLCKRASA